MWAGQELLCAVRNGGDGCSLDQDSGSVILKDKVPQVEVRLLVLQVWEKSLISVLRYMFT